MHNAPNSVRHVRLSVRHGVRHQTRDTVGLCGVCGMAAPAPARSAQKPAAPSMPHMRANHAAHAAHTARPAICAGFASSHAAHHAAHIPHTLYSFIFLKEREGEVGGVGRAGRQGLKTTTTELNKGAGMGKGFMRCNEANVAEFNARLRAECPEAFELAKALRAAGLITGLRGAAIGEPGSLPEEGTVPVLSFEAERRIADLHWKREGRKA